ncbi:polyprenyl synthetase family protein [Actinosynnema sp. NPDC023587]|uniref:polyprenyl synthetase family protein n=1 Tax=Actinosynnema sp. NPDC023587 TaxID=3154695 RepID=UPI003406B2E9
MASWQALRTTGAADVLTRTHALLRPAMSAALDRLDDRLRRIAGYHLGLWDGDGTPAAADTHVGKGARPALTVLSAEAVGAPADQALLAAVAVELVHSFTGLHDDIIDGDELRRDRAATWTVFGTPHALLTGDALLVLAGTLLCGGPEHRVGAAMSALWTAVHELVDNESKDSFYPDRIDVPPEVAAATTIGKTAPLSRCACELGALYGDAPPARRASLRDFGWHAGAAWALHDDINGIVAPAEVTGKPAHSDLRNRKTTPPVAAALTRSTEPAATARLVELYTRPGELAEADLAEAAALVERAGGLDWTRREADRHLAAARSCLEAADPLDPAGTALRSLTGLFAPTTPTAGTGGEDRPRRADHHAASRR